ncbi:hypothetical protein B0H16DRAFT_1887476 [Mycena metata]|uniref:Uncharacterized protein n=1 Tax=Mycena metata TaxID=1033252 RepID=A0AAD7N9Q0_9AGAR|nr:hypothetical protein B0H16DRAFT_1887476 [Mycena metata]
MPLSSGTKGVNPVLATALRVPTAFARSPQLAPSIWLLTTPTTCSAVRRSGTASNEQDDARWASSGRTWWRPSPAHHSSQQPLPSVSLGTAQNPRPLSVIHLLALAPLLRGVDIARALMAAIEAEHSPWTYLLPPTIASYSTDQDVPRRNARHPRLGAISSSISVDASSSNGGRVLLSTPDADSFSNAGYVRTRPVGTAPIWILILRATSMIFALRRAQTQSQGNAPPHAVPTLSPPPPPLPMPTLPQSIPNIKSRLAFRIFTLALPLPLGLRLGRAPSTHALYAGSFRSSAWSSASASAPAPASFGFRNLVGRGAQSVHVDGVACARVLFLVSHARLELGMRMPIVFWGAAAAVVGLYRRLVLVLVRIRGSTMEFFETEKSTSGRFEHTFRFVLGSSRTHLTLRPPP